MFFFTSYIWGCRHAGMNGQRVSNLISSIHRSLCNNLPLLSRLSGIPNVSGVSNTGFNTLNYSDDFGSAAADFFTAQVAFKAMGGLLEELGFSESHDKAIAPTQVLTYLGVEFDSNELVMRIDSEKCEELSA